MKPLAAALILFVVAGFAAPADAYVIEVTTAVDVADAANQGEVREALEAAVARVLKDAVAFTPTLVVLTRAIVVGDRLYVRLLIADQEGERTVEEFGAGEAGGGERLQI